MDTVSHSSVTFFNAVKTRNQFYSYVQDSRRVERPADSSLVAPGVVLAHTVVAVGTAHIAAPFLTMATVVVVITVIPALALLTVVGVAALASAPHLTMAAVMVVAVVVIPALAVVAVLAALATTPFLAMAAVVMVIMIIVVIHPALAVLAILTATAATPFPTMVALLLAESIERFVSALGVHGGIGDIHDGIGTEVKSRGGGGHHGQHSHDRQGDQGHNGSRLDIRAHINS
ncbi:unnamed protein product [Mortierella alpina]